MQDGIAWAAESASSSTSPPTCASTRSIIRLGARRCITSPIAPITIGPTPLRAEFFEWRREHAVIIGHDMWIGHGADPVAQRQGRQRGGDRLRRDCDARRRCLYDRRRRGGEEKSNIASPRMSASAWTACLVDGSTKYCAPRCLIFAPSAPRRLRRNTEPERWILDGAAAPSRTRRSSTPIASPRLFSSNGRRIPDIGEGEGPAEGVDFEGEHLIPASSSCTPIISSSITCRGPRCSGTRVAGCAPTMRKSPRRASRPCSIRPHRH